MIFKRKVKTVSLKVHKLVNLLSVFAIASPKGRSVEQVGLACRFLFGCFLGFF